MQNLPTSSPVQGAPPGSGYEFTDAQNKVLDRLASRMLWAGIIQIVFGAMQLVGNCSVQSGGGKFSISATSGPFYIVIIIVGAMLVSASRSFKRIVTTQGDDIKHLMAAFTSLSRAAMVEIVSFIIIGIFALLLIVLLIVLFVFLAAMLKSLTG